jgi:AraC-like DNA-binding protein
MDALSDVLRVVRLKGGVFLHAEFTAPWCIQTQIAQEDCGTLLGAVEHLVLYHYVVEGRLRAQIPARWRIQLAAHQLRSSDTPLARIATQVGYESEAAFNRAFKRSLGVPPAAWRRNVLESQNPLGPTS